MFLLKESVIGFEGVSNMALDASNNIYLTGYFAGTTGSTQVLQLLTGFLLEVMIYLGKYDSNGNYLYAYSFGTTLPDAGNGITTDRTGNVYMVGTFNTVLDLDPSVGANVFHLTVRICLWLNPGVCCCIYFTY